MSRSLLAPASIAVIAIIFIVVVLAAILQPKAPDVLATSTTLRRIEVGVGVPIVSLNITMSVEVYIKNRSFAGFNYKDSTTAVFYHEVLVGEAPIEAGAIPGHAVRILSTPVDIDSARLVAHPQFLKEIGSGLLGFTSSTGVDGNGVFLGAFKVHATISVRCDITVFILKGTLSSSCNSIVKV